MKKSKEKASGLSQEFCYCWDFVFGKMFWLRVYESSFESRNREVVSSDSVIDGRYDLPADLSETKSVLKYR